MGSVTGITNKTGNLLVKIISIAGSRVYLFGIQMHLSLSLGLGQ